MIDETIRGLDDDRAARVMMAFAEARIRAGGAPEKAWTPELDRALRREFPAGDGPDVVSGGDLARQALLLLADDPRNEEALPWLIGMPTGVFAGFGVGTASLLVAALVVLQTHIRFERDQDGEVQVTVERTPTQDGLLPSLVAMIARLRPES